MQSLRCHKCQELWEFEPPLGRRDECPKCGRDAHVCLNCAHYDKNAHHECREPTAEYVKEKEQSNFCDAFTSSTRQGGGAQSEAAKARAHLEGLFGKNTSEPPTEGGGGSLADELARFLKK